MRQRKRKQKNILPDVLVDWEDVMTRIIYQEELKVLNKDVIIWEKFSRFLLTR